MIIFFIHRQCNNFFILIPFNFNWFFLCHHSVCLFCQHFTILFWLMRCDSVRFDSLTDSLTCCLKMKIRHLLKYVWWYGDGIHVITFEFFRHSFDLHSQNHRVRKRKNQSKIRGEETKRRNRKLGSEWLRKYGKDTPRKVTFVSILLYICQYIKFVYYAFIFMARAPLQIVLLLLYSKISNRPDASSIRKFNSITLYVPSLGGLVRLHHFWL